MADISQVPCQRLCPSRSALQLGFGEGGCGVFLLRAIENAMVGECRELAN